MYDLDSSLVKSSQVTHGFPFAHFPRHKLDFVRFIELHARSLGNLASSARRARHLPARLIPLVPGPSTRLTSCWCCGIGSNRPTGRRRFYRESWNPRFELRNGQWSGPPFAGVRCWASLVLVSECVHGPPAALDLKPSGGSSEDLAIHSTLGAPW